MKKWIASLMTLCLLTTVTAAGWSGVWTGALAEATVEVVVTPAPATADTGSGGSGTAEKAAAVTPTQAPAAETLSDTGSAQPSPAQTQESNAAGEPTPAATDAQGDGAEGETQAAPDATVDAEEPTPDPETLDDEQTGAPVVTEAPVAEANVGSGPAWITEGAHRRYGEINDLLEQAIINHVPVMLCTTGVSAVYGYSVDVLRTVGFGMDSDALGEYCDGKSVIISVISPDRTTRDQTVYIWIGRASDVPSASDTLGDEVTLPPDDSALLEAEVEVTAENYTAEAPCTPTFTLTAYPEPGDGMTFAVIVDGGTPQPIEGNTFTPVASGEYRFAVLDADGVLKGRSAAFNVTMAATETPVVSETPADGETTPEPSESPEPTETPTPEETVLTPEDITQDVALADALADVEPQTPEISVRAYDYTEGTPTDVTPQFTLSGAPEQGGYYYALSINGGTLVRLLSNTYAVTKSGDFTIAFSLLDGNDAVVDTSGTYHVIVDYADAASNNEAWMAQGKTRQYGTLASLLSRAKDGATIYLLTSDVIVLADASRLSGVTLAADPDTFGDGAGVVVSSNNPDMDV